MKACRARPKKQENPPRERGMDGKCAAKKQERRRVESRKTEECAGPDNSTQKQIMSARFHLIDMMLLLSTKMRPAESEGLERVTIQTTMTIVKHGGARTEKRAGLGRRAGR